MVYCTMTLMQLQIWANIQELIPQIDCSFPVPWNLIIALPADLQKVRRTLPFQISPSIVER